jgi:hypothetical protein
LSRPPPSSEHGFTILECQIALLVLTLAVVLLMKMIAGHDKVLQDMDGWLEGDAPTYYVVPRTNDFERWLGHRPDLSTTQVSGGGGGGGGGPKDYQVKILSTTRELHPPTLNILVQLRAL